MKINFIHGCNIQVWVGKKTCRINLARGYMLFPNGRKRWSGWHEANERGFTIKTVPISMTKKEFYEGKGKPLDYEAY